MIKSQMDDMEQRLTRIENLLNIDNSSRETLRMLLSKLIEVGKLMKYMNIQRCNNIGISIYDGQIEIDIPEDIMEFVTNSNHADTKRIMINKMIETDLKIHWDSRMEQNTHYISDES